VTAVAPHAPGLALDERWGGVAVRRYRYGPDATETLAYAGTMHEQALRSWRARARLLRLVGAGRGAVRTLIRELRPDVIHAHWWFPGGLIGWLGRRRGPALVLTSHGTDLFLLDRYRAARLLAGVIFRSAGQVTVVSSPLVSRVQTLGVDPGRITVVPMPLDATTFSPGQGGVREPGLVLFAGRLIERKGVEYAVRAVAQLRKAGRAVRLVIAGEGPERPRLARLAAELGTAEGVVFRGWVTAVELASLYQRAQVFVLPAITDWKGEQEGFGMVLAEAMHSGLAVVATRSGGIPDVVRHEETGLLIPERDPAALAAAVARLMDDTQFAARLAHAARSDIGRRFEPAAIARTFEAVYQAAHAEFLRRPPRTRLCSP
jgi:glycosyltransferase involved in cell wall biosynthesis